MRTCLHFALGVDFGEVPALGHEVLLLDRDWPFEFIDAVKEIAELEGSY